MTTPLKITAHLISPLAGDAPMLDAILEWVMSFRMASVMRSSNGHRHLVPVRPRGQPVSEAGKIPIPIARTWIDRLPIPHCSVGILPTPLADAHDHINKALGFSNSPLLADSERKTVMTTGGIYKSYRLPLRMRLVDRVVWFCAVRESEQGAPASEVRRLLRHVPAIGKKTSDGYGRVSEWTVEKIEHDWSWFAPSDNGPVLMRPLPQAASLPDGLVGFRRWFGSPCPPYWQRSFYREIVQPC